MVAAEFNSNLLFYLILSAFFFYFSTTFPTQPQQPIRLPPIFDESTPPGEGTDRKEKKEKDDESHERDLQFC